MTGHKTIKNDNLVPVSIVDSVGGRIRLIIIRLEDIQQGGHQVLYHQKEGKVPGHPVCHRARHHLLEGPHLEVDRELSVPSNGRFHLSLLRTEVVQDDIHQGDIHLDNTNPATERVYHLLRIELEGLLQYYLLGSRQVPIDSRRVLLDEKCIVPILQHNDPTSDGPHPADCHHHRHQCRGLPLDHHLN